jgi:hypothetical protein
MTDPFIPFLNEVIDDYLDLARNSFQQRIDAWNVDIDIFDKEVNEVLGGLLARQLSLATNIARNPHSWNAHLLPALLRCMAEVYINFCWIVLDKPIRCRQFIEYGLGQEKLAIEHYRESLLQEAEPDPNAEQFLSTREMLLENEKASFMVPVNLGAWSEKSVRAIAIEAGEKQFYDLVFVQFSAPVHSTWQHIWQFNLLPCTNPLHMGHRNPVDPDVPIDPKLFSVSAKYLCKLFAKFDTAVLGLAGPNDSHACYELLCDRFAKYFADNPADGDDRE